MYGIQIIDFVSIVSHKEWEADTQSSSVVMSDIVCCLRDSEWTGVPCDRIIAAEVGYHMPESA